MNDMISIGLLIAVIGCYDGGCTMTVYEMAKTYYPRLWSIDRLRALLDAGKLTQAEYDELTKTSEG